VQESIDAGKKLEWDELVKWANAAKPGQECLDPCARCGENFTELIIFGGMGRYLVLKYNAGGHY